MLKIIGIGLGAVIVLFVGIGFALPSGYEVSRSVIIDAPPEMIHSYVGELKNWEEWTPWRDLDPTMKTTYGLITSGVGAHQNWTGDSGNGELTFTASDESGIVYDLSFDEGAYQSVGRVIYEKSGDGTKVTWDMKGDAGMNIIGRYFGIMMDSMVGPPFEQGLTKLKDRVESIPPALAMDIATADGEESEVDPAGESAEESAAVPAD